MTLLGSLDSASAPSVDVDVVRVTRDSRGVAAGDVFVAIPGTQRDGHAFVAGLPPGAVAVVERPTDAPPGVIVVVVADAKAALSRLSAAVVGFPARDLSVVGITGTNGKTTTSTLVTTALEKLGRTVARMGTTGTRLAGQDLPGMLTTPEAPELHGVFAQLRDLGGRVAVMEVSSIGLIQHRVDDVPFALAVFTNLTRDHLDFHGSMKAYAEAKATLFTHRLRDPGGLPRALLQGDDGTWRQMRPPTDRWLYGFDAGSDVRITSWIPRADGATLCVETPLGSAVIDTPLLGRHNAYNLAAALAIGAMTGEVPQSMADALRGVVGAPGRLEPVPNATGVAVLVDYAHTPDALSAVLASVRASTKGKVWVVFGCGGDRDRGKRHEMGRAALAADRVIVTSDNPRSEDPNAILADILEGIPQGSAVVEVDRATAIHLAIREASPGDVVLLAGKGHEDYQEIAGVKHPFDDRRVAAEALAAR